MMLILSTSLRYAQYLEYDTIAREICTADLTNSLNMRAVLYALH
jgi:hypothetical protein